MADVTATSAVGLWAVALRELLAANASYRTLLGVSTTADAKTRTLVGFRAEKAMQALLADSGIGRPFVMIYDSEEQESDELIAVSTSYRPTRLQLHFFGELAATYKADDRNAWVTAENTRGSFEQILRDINGGESGGYRFCHGGPQHVAGVQFEPRSENDDQDTVYQGFDFVLGLTSSPAAA